MVLQVDYLPIANAGGANVQTQQDYAADPTLPTGYATGIVPSPKFNKSWRQVTVMVAALANYISQQLQISVLDDGNVANLVSEIASAVQTGANIKPARVVSSSAPLNITAGDSAIALQRTVAVAPQIANLPTGAQNGQEFELQDVVGNLNAFPVTVTPPAGHNIANEATFVMAIDRQSARFKFFFPNTWSVAT
jgi:hypothetical protein